MTALGRRTGRSQAYSQLLRHMQSLLGTWLPTFDQSLLKELFLNRLPPQTRMVLAALPDSTLEAFLRSPKKSPHAAGFAWTANAVDVFLAAKEALANAVVLIYPRHDAHTSLAVDASGSAIGAVLQQHINQQWQPISFFSVTLAGPTTLQRLRPRTPCCVRCRQVLPLISGRPIFYPLYGSSSTGVHRPFVPSGLRRQTLHALHDVSHPGIRATRRLIGDRYVWPGMAKDIQVWTSRCITCQRTKIVRHTRPPPGKFLPPDRRFQIIHIDLVGPLPHSSGFRYILTMVDRFTRWPEAVPIIDMRAETVARALLDAWICRYGTPDQVVTDRGAQFESSLFHELCGLFGTTRTRTTAYHPCANDLVERFHRQMKSCFRALRHPEKWTSALPLILLHVRACLKPDLGCSAVELVFGTHLRLPADLVTQQPPISSENQPQATRSTSRSSVTSSRPLGLLLHGSLLAGTLTFQPLSPRPHTFSSGLQPLASP
ncbi:uncharacterized protein LOC135379836 [Ornithodoros turicata]|uniref:uncharacterized protein LOC135379836 n=1 Tax=Ornithodoros turicata TaxID=34597 RepID=UPI003139F541